MADSGSDNPILDMGLLQMMQPNKYINPAFAGKPLALPGFYTGQAGAQPPTDAYGKPIQSFVDANNTAQSDYQKQLAAFNAGQPAQGTTLNTTPAGGQPAGGTNTPGPLTPTGYGPLDQLVQARQQATAGQQQTPYGGAGTNPLATAAAAGATPQQLGQMFSQMSPTIPSYTDTGQRGGQAVMGPGTTPNPNYQRVMGQLFANSFGGAAPARPAAPSPPSPPDMRQAYLDALADPGPPTKVGANVPESNPLGVPSVMNAFMAAHPSGGSKGAGNYDNSGFFSTLSNLRSA